MQAIKITQGEDTKLPSVGFEPITLAESSHASAITLGHSVMMEFPVKPQQHLTLRESTFVASPMLEILSQIEIKFSCMPMKPFLVYMHGTCLTFGNNMTSSCSLTVL